MTHVLGIDLGGTAVAAAIADDDGRVEMVALGDRSTTVPSVVHRRDATSLVTGELAARRAAGDPDHSAWAVRRRLGDPAPVLLGEDAIPAGDLLAAIMRDVLARVTAVRGLVADRVVLTHPASWGPYRRGLFEDVVVAAGLEDAVTMADPEAAGHQHRAIHGLDDGTALAIYDLGGSAFEATVLTRRGRGVELVGTPVGIERLGGVDFDEAVIALVDEATGGLLADLDPDDDTSVAALGRLRQDCVAAKEALSTDDEAMVPVLLPGRHEDVTVARAAFEERIRPVVARSVEALERAVEAAPVRPAAVLLVGGSSRVPLVQRIVGERLGLPVIVDARPEEIVALGAARAAQAAAPSVTRVTSMVGTELSARSGSKRSAKAAAGADSGKPADSTKPAAGTDSAEPPAAATPPAAAAPAPVSAAAAEPAAPSEPEPTRPERAAASSGAAPSTTPTREPDQDSASTTLVPSPIVDGRVVTGSDESRTVIARPTPAKPAAPAQPAEPADDAGKTTVTRTTPSDAAKTTIVRPNPPAGTPAAGTPAAGTPAAGAPSTGRPPAAAPPPRRPPGPPPRQPGRPAPPSGAFPAQGRPSRPGGPGPGGPGPRPGWSAGPPGGRPGGPPGGPPPGRPMTGPFPGPAGPGPAGPGPGGPGPGGPGPGGPGPTPPQAAQPKSSNRTRTVVLVVAGVVVLLVLVAALVFAGVL